MFQMSPKANNINILGIFCYFKSRLPIFSTYFHELIDLLEKNQLKP